MKISYLVVALVLLVSCRTQKKATAEYEAYMAEFGTNPNDKINAKGHKGELKNLPDQKTETEKAKTAGDSMEWPGEAKNTEPVEAKIIVKEEEATLLAGEDSKMEGFKYFVIIGSFANEVNARNYKAIMSEKGFTPSILENKSGYFRVAIFQSNSEEEARKKVHSVRAKYPEHKDVWLLSRSGK